jgi:hypothetical protein
MERERRPEQRARRKSEPEPARPGPVPGRGNQPDWRQRQRAAIDPAKADSMIESRATLEPEAPRLEPRALAKARRANPRYLERLDFDPFRFGGDLDVGSADFACAVAAYQGEAGLTVDGIAGPITCEAIGALPAAPESGAAMGAAALEHSAIDPDKQVIESRATLSPADLGRPIQRRAAGPATTDDIHATAARGVAGSATALPHAARIQAAFGRHDISNVRAHIGAEATEAAAAIGAEAYATGQDLAFGQPPDLETTAHEAAHAIHQRAGVSLKGGVGEPGDPYEQNADAVAAAVVRGESAEGLLDEIVGAGGAKASGAAIQRKESASPGRRTIKQQAPKAAAVEDGRFTSHDELSRARLVLRAAATVARDTLTQLQQIGRAGAAGDKGRQLLESGCDAVAGHVVQAFDPGVPVLAQIGIATQLFDVTDFAWGWTQSLLQAADPGHALRGVERLRAATAAHARTMTRAGWNPTSNPREALEVARATGEDTVDASDKREVIVLSLRKIHDQLSRSIDKMRGRLDGDSRVDFTEAISRAALPATNRLSYLVGTLGAEIARHREAIRDELEAASAQVSRLQRWAVHSEVARTEASQEVGAMIAVANELRHQAGLAAIEPKEAPDGDEKEQLARKTARVAKAYRGLYEHQELGVEAVAKASAGTEDRLESLSERLIWAAIEGAITVAVGGVGGAVAVAVESLAADLGSGKGPAKMLASGLKDLAKAGIKSAVAEARSGHESQETLREDFFEGAKSALIKLGLKQAQDVAIQLSELERASEPFLALDRFERAFVSQYDAALESQKLATLQEWMMLLGRADNRAGRIFPPEEDEGIDLDPGAMSGGFPRGMLHLDVAVNESGQPRINTCRVRGLNPKLRRLLRARPLGAITVPLHVDGLTPNKGSFHIMRNDTGTIWVERNSRSAPTELGSKWLSELAGEAGKPTDEAVIRGARLFVDDQMAELVLPDEIEAIQ